MSEKGFGISIKPFGDALPRWWGRPKFRSGSQESPPMSQYWQYESFPSEFKSNYWGLRGTDHKTYFPGEEVMLWGTWSPNSGYNTPTGYLPTFTLSHPDADTSTKQEGVQKLLLQPTDARFNNAFNLQVNSGGTDPTLTFLKVAKIVEKSDLTTYFNTYGLTGLDLTKPFVLGLSGYNTAAHQSGGAALSFAKGMTSTVEVFINPTGPTNQVDCSMQFRQITATANPDSNGTIALNNYNDLVSRKASFAKVNATASGYIELSSNNIYNCHGSVFDGNGESIFYFADNGVTTQNIEIKNGTFINCRGIASVQGGLRKTSRITFRRCTFMDTILGSDMIGTTRMEFTDTHFIDCDFIRSSVGSVSNLKNCMFRNCMFYQKHKKASTHPIFINSGDAVSFVQCIFDSTDRGVIMSAYIADTSQLTGASESEIKKWLATGAIAATAGYASDSKFGSIRGYHTNYLFAMNYFDNIKFSPNGCENIMVEGGGCNNCNYNNGGTYNSLFLGNVHSHDNDGWPLSSFFAGFHNNIVYNTISESKGTLTFSYGAQGNSYGIEDTETVADNQFLTTQQNNFIWMSQFKGNAARGSLEFGRAAQNNKVYQSAFVNPAIGNFGLYFYTPWFYKHLPNMTNLPTGVEPPYGRLPPAVTGNFAVIRNLGTGNSMVDCSIVVEGMGLTAVHLRNGISWKAFDGVQINMPLTY
jgi:hypothetical protein